MILYLIDCEYKDMEFDYNQASIWAKTWNTATMSARQSNIERSDPYLDWAQHHFGHSFDKFFFRYVTSEGLN